MVMLEATRDQRKDENVRVSIVSMIDQKKSGVTDFSTLTRECTYALTAFSISLLFGSKDRHKPKDC